MIIAAGALLFLFGASIGFVVALIFQQNIYEEKLFRELDERFLPIDAKVTRLLRYMRSMPTEKAPDTTFSESEIPTDPKK
jgi:hypothetical protein